ncbi:hypothetical protein ACFVZ2_35665, partial [Streptomyces lasiicapitis]
MAAHPRRTGRRRAGAAARKETGERRVSSRDIILGRVRRALGDAAGRTPEPYEEYEAAVDRGYLREHGART